MLSGWVPNETPWVDRVVTSTWDRLVAAVPEDLLPATRVEKKKRVALEFGCGHYGCVMPVARPRTVLKITTDVTEARFVSILPTLRAFGELDGLVQYHMIRAVADSRRHGKPVFLIWREEARDVGGACSMPYYLKDSADSRIRDELRARTFLFNFLDGAREVRYYIGEGKPGWEKRRERVSQALPGAYAFAAGRHGWAMSTALGSLHNPNRAAVAVAMCEHQAHALQATDVLFHVGHALAFLLSSGILLADVHLNNIGTVDRPDHDKPLNVITDPGHMVLLDESVQPQPIPYL